MGPVEQKNQSFQTKPEYTSQRQKKEITKPEAKKLLINFLGLDKNKNTWK